MKQNTIIHTLSDDTYHTLYLGSRLYEENHIDFEFKLYWTKCETRLNYRSFINITNDFFKLW